jgi:mycothiol synthase
MEDVQAVAKLTYDVAQMEGDTMFVMKAEELANVWQDDAFQVERDVFVVETQDGRIVGSEEFYNESGHHRLKADGCVHPQFRGLGIGSSLLEQVARRAESEMVLAKPTARVAIRIFMNNEDEAGHKLLRANGYALVRYFWRMEVKLAEAPEPAVFPDGIELRPFIQDEHGEAVWQADLEVFRDHWGSHEMTFKDWSKKFSNPNYDPSLWMVAWDSNEIAGFSQNRMRQGIGWVGTIGVRQPWRNQGLGLALLRHSFGEFYKRGTTTISLGVDSANLTGANRLYQRAGMRVVSELALYEKELRAGIS